MTEGHYKLPKGWGWVRLGEVFELQQGASMSPKKTHATQPVEPIRKIGQVGGLRISRPTCPWAFESQVVVGRAVPARRGKGKMKFHAAV